MASNSDLRTLAKVAIRDGENWRDRRLPEMGRALNEVLDELDLIRRFMSWRTFDGQETELEVYERERESLKQDVINRGL